MNNAEKRAKEAARKALQKFNFAPGGLIKPRVLTYESVLAIATFAANYALRVNGQLLKIEQMQQEMAIEFAISDIESNGYFANKGKATRWYDVHVDDTYIRKTLSRAVTVLEAHGLLVRHKTEPHWVRIKPAAKESK